MKEASQSEVDFEQCREGGRLLLFEAVRLYWLNNGRGRPPLQTREQILFAQTGDAQKEIQARVGRLRLETKTRSFVEPSRSLSEELQNPIVRGDRSLSLW